MLNSFEERRNWSEDETLNWMRRKVSSGHVKKLWALFPSRHVRHRQGDGTAFFRRSVWVGRVCPILNFIKILFLHGNFHDFLVSFIWFVYRVLPVFPQVLRTNLGH